MTADVDFIEDVVQRFPQLAGDYDAHVGNNGGPLPHVFFWDVTQAVVHARNGTNPEYADLDWRGLLSHLEEVHPRAPIEVKEVIVTSFLLNLPWPQEPGSGIAAELGPVLSEKFKEVRPAG
jgi:hypothetical protein